MTSGTNSNRTNGKHTTEKRDGARKPPPLAEWGSARIQAALIGTIGRPFA
jgi:hypothetical protein